MVVYRPNPGASQKPGENQPPPERATNLSPSEKRAIAGARHVAKEQDLSCQLERTHLAAEDHEVEDDAVVQAVLKQLGLSKPARVVCFVLDDATGTLRESHLSKNVGKDRQRLIRDFDNGLQCASVGLTSQSTQPGDGLSFDSGFGSVVGQDTVQSDVTSRRSSVTSSAYPRQGSTRRSLQQKPSSRKRKNRSPSCDSHDLESVEEEEEEDDDDDDGPDEGPVSPLVGTVIQISNAQQCKDFYMKALHAVQQLTMKEILKAWIKVICPSKRTTYPYSVGKSMKKQRRKNGVKSSQIRHEDCTPGPPWWPKHVRHIEPDHLGSPERLELAAHILTSFELRRLPQPTWTADLQKITNDYCQLGTQKELLGQLGREKQAARRKMIKKVFQVAIIQEEVHRGWQDDFTYTITDFPILPKVASQAKAAKSDEEDKSDSQSKPSPVSRPPPEREDTVEFDMERLAKPKERMPVTVLPSQPFQPSQPSQMPVNETHGLPLNDVLPQAFPHPTHPLREYRANYDDPSSYSNCGMPPPASMSGYDDVKYPVDDYYRPAPRLLCHSEIGDQPRHHYVQYLNPQPEPLMSGQLQYPSADLNATAHGYYDEYYSYGDQPAAPPSSANSSFDAGSMHGISTATPSVPAFDQSVYLHGPQQQQQPQPQYNDYVPQQQHQSHQQRNNMYRPC
ncbi:hypothetical protein K402DRAFT_425618 [Aulographum hederae CBS 113979]|uniref:Subtelomeric hrmA-associated cluster protein AFUB-079030/YDR124W-like helical bundle domain-containing protein n=1 Tax=Aulographum hederae CBS 113979 TaxID=1176131 RepID=A0A6G1GJR5_9PEZI|nr:hypothetical protein K402DRAFT_425618 [Aulographum hederae CBS 113979]